MRKVILFIVEGKTEKLALEGILSNIICNCNVEFQIINGDIFSDKRNKVNIRDKIKLILATFVGNNPGIEFKNIKEVVILSDTDGCFIDNKFVIEDNNKKVIYNRSDIRCPNKSNICERNELKSKQLKDLIEEGINIKKGIKFSIYYFSVNLDDVLYCETNLDSYEKVKLANAFNDKYINNTSAFIKLINNKDLVLSNNYSDSWALIQNDNNSLNRKSNFNIFLKEYEMV